MSNIKRLNLPSEQDRIKIKKLANGARYRFSQQGIVDIFNILENEAFLIRKPLEKLKISGFSTYFDEAYIVFLNSSYTLGHERYTAAHELYHILYNAEILKREIIINNDKHEEEDKKANIFAAEFLMPEDYVKELFYKLINVDPKSVTAKDVVILNNIVGVSYRAMLKRLVQLKLCDENLFETLALVGSIDNKGKLQSITINEGYKTDLIIPSNEEYISREYIEISRKNYEEGKISFTKLKELLEFIGRNPSDYGHTDRNWEEDDWV
ncbi:TPA: ImmA/IrrE family metallo-endopeptidase [Clostridioides difficile]